MRRLVVLLTALALVLAFAQPVTAAPQVSTKAAAGPLIGLVTDGPVLYDRSYNQYAWAGVRAGALAIGGRSAVVVSDDQGDYAANIGSLVSRGARVVVTVGFLMTDATVAAAATYNRVQFIGIDQVPSDAIPANYQGLDFDRAQSGYLAGIVAGWLSRTGTIGAVGGMEIPPVEAFINGYRNGAAAVQPGIDTIVVYTDAFNDPDRGYDAAAGLIDDDADVIFGVAGWTNEGVIKKACEAGVWAIGVDIDQYLQLPQYRGCIVTSAVQRIAPATTKAILRWYHGLPGFQTGIYLNDASNLGIGLAPIRNIVPSPRLLQRLAAAYVGLANGSISPCDPIACDTP